MVPVFDRLPKKNDTLLFLLILMFLRLAVYGITEQEVVVTALKNNKAIRIIILDQNLDSLEREKVESGWLPKVSIELGQSITPYDSVSALGSPGSKTSSLSSGLTLSIQQAIPGGGRVEGALSERQNTVVNTDTLIHATKAEIIYTQPLLKNAWKNGVLGYTIAIQNLDAKKFSLEQKIELLSVVSEIRNLYWSYYETFMLCTIFLDRLTYTQKHLISQRSRFYIGTATALDTLTARLDYLEAGNQLLNAQTNRNRSQQELTRALDYTGDSLLVDTTMAITFSSLPESAQFLSMVEGFDPKLQIFHIINDKLLRQKRHDKNSLYPDVNFSITYSKESLGERIFNNFNSFSSNTVLSLVAQYSLPIKPHRIQQKQRYHSLQKNDLSQQSYTSELHLKIDELVRSWKTELQSLAYGQASLDIAEKRFIAAKTGYQVGTVDQFTLDKAENDFVELKIRLFQKRIVMKKLEIIFDEITGHVFERFGVNLE